MFSTNSEYILPWSFRNFRDEQLSLSYTAACQIYIAVRALHTVKLSTSANITLRNIQHSAAKTNGCSEMQQIKLTRKSTLPDGKSGKTYYSYLK